MAEIQTICINSDCGESFSVPSGTQAGVCPHCNTWQPVTASSPSDQVGPSSIPPGFGGPSSGIDAGPGPGPISGGPGPGDGGGPGGSSLENPGGASQWISVTLSKPGTKTEKPTAPQGSDVVATLESDLGEVYPIHLGEASMGRSGTDLVFNDLTVSRTHAYLFVVYEEKEVKVEICDASHKGGRGSANGVFISGRSQRLESHEKIRLRDGSSITLGKCKLKLKIKKFA